MNIARLDKNFAPGSKTDRTDVKFYDVRSGLFDIYGLLDPYNENEPFHRMSPEVAAKANVNVNTLNYCTSGGRIRFKTDSEFVAIRAEYSSGTFEGGVGNMNAIGISGYDLYIYIDGKPVCFKSYNPGDRRGRIFEAVLDFETSEERELLINFPLYDSCKNLCIGVRESAKILHGSPYKYQKPIVYYGSSITQGGCASRPGFLSGYGFEVL